MPLVVKVIAHTKFLGVPDDLLPIRQVIDKLERSGVMAVNPDALPAMAREIVTEKGQDVGTDAERLVECAGRTCYSSYGAGRPSSEYHQHIMDVDHGCYDGETQVLTQAGWREWADVNQDDLFATLNTNTGGVEYHRASKLIRYTHAGRMYRVSSREVDLLVTPDHKMYCCLTTTKIGRKKTQYELLTAEQVGVKSHAYAKACGGVLHEQATPVPTALYSLLGFAIGDGCIGGRMAYVKFRLRRTRKIRYLHEKAAEAGVVVDTQENDTYALRLDKDAFDLFAAMYDAKGEKVIPRHVLFAERAIQEALFDGMLNSDGSQSDTGDCYDTTSEVLAGQFQQLCLHIGLSANISQAVSYAERGENKNPIYRCHIIRTRNKPEVNKFVDGVGKTEWVEGWEGEVYCAEVPNNTLYVRRGGKPVWSGNSVTEHVTLTFFLSGISRGLTHELVRHRVGVAISQRSTRYVDENESTWALHPLLNEFFASLEHAPARASNGEQVELSLQQKTNHVIDTAKRTYRDVVERLQSWLIAKGADKFTARKQARGAARGLLGNALMTEMVWTCNLRTLKTVLGQRAKGAADAEIRLLANRLYEEALPYWPTYLGRYLKRPCPDGIGYELFLPDPKDAEIARLKAELEAAKAPNLTMSGVDMMPTTIPKDQA